MKRKSIAKVLLPALMIGSVFVKTSLAEETPEELKAQIEALKQQMAAMQQQMASMQALIETLQGKLKQVETKTEKLTPQFVAKESKPVFGKPGLEWQLYGRVKMDYHYDTARIEKYNDFVGAVKNRWSASYNATSGWSTSKVSDYQNDSTNFNPRDTRFGALVFHKRGNWVIKGHTEIDFYGTNAGNNIIPRIRLAYVDIYNSKTRTSLRFGQDWIPVAQLNPSTIEFGILTAAGNLWWRVPQLTVRQKVFTNWEILGSLMMHRRISTGSEERMPWLLARIQYKDGVLNKVFGKGSMIAIGGGYKHEAVEADEDASFPREYFNESDVDRWLVVGEWKLNFELFDQKFQFKGEAWTGRGIDDEFLRYDLGVNAYGEPIEAYGLWGNLVWNINPRWTFSIGAGFDDPNDSEILKGQEEVGAKALNDRQFTKNTQYFANLWYKLTDHVRIGAEVMHIETERDEWVDTANRFTLSAFYNF